MAARKGSRCVDPNGEAYSPKMPRMAMSISG